ncbi:uncharacterized protein LOC126795682 [Argentina anserina]|uniref:uncharacterized protein LOC126795682 n=1 Tax=Argentina anserina TaxID=57926 RepID=UPI0021768348|nr:uncharacterized protein LOC126795682 [Potentilla anserina]
MASLQPSWLSSPNLFPSSKPDHPSKPFKLFFSLNSPNESDAKELPPAVKAAMEKAKEYKQKKQGTKTNTGSGRFRAWISWDLGLRIRRRGGHCQLGWFQLQTIFRKGTCLRLRLLLGTLVSSEQGQERLSNRRKETETRIFTSPGCLHGDISKTFGGGRVIRPGEVLETEEEKAAKEARTRQLVAAYKSKMGLNIDPKLRLDCEKALHDGDSLMNIGKLKEAITYDEKVMDKLPFKSHLHGLAALQWSICQDSLSRTKEAQIMYERLQSHPTARVSKKARQFMFSFQAMEMMKVTRSSPWRNTDYQNFFEAFIDYKSDYPLEDGEVEVGTLSQILPYMFFLVSPILFVLLIAIQKRI